MIFPSCITGCAGSAPRLLGQIVMEKMTNGDLGKRGSRTSFGIMPRGTTSIFCELTQMDIFCQARKLTSSKWQRIFADHVQYSVPAKPVGWSRGPSVSLSGLRKGWKLARITFVREFRWWEDGYIWDFRRVVLDTLLSYQERMV